MAFCLVPVFAALAIAGQWAYRALNDLSCRVYVSREGIASISVFDTSLEDLRGDYPCIRFEMSADDCSPTGQLRRDPNAARERFTMRVVSCRQA